MNVARQGIQARSRHASSYLSALREAALGYLFIIPSFAIIVVFGLYPVLRAGYISLHEWSIIKGRFIGLMNYQRLLKDPDFWQALQVTVFYVIATVPLTMMFSLVMAYLLLRPTRFRALFRSLYFLPYVTSMVPAAMVWQWIFNYQAGILNAIAGWASKGVAGFLRVIRQSPGGYVWALLMVAWIAYVSFTARRRTSLSNGFQIVIAMLLLLVGVVFLWSPEGLQNTVKQLETFFPVRWLQEPRGIILYLGKKWGFTPPTFFLLIISTIGAFRAFTMFYVLTSGGPLKTTTSVTYLVYDKFYSDSKWGYASAIAFILFGIILIMTLLNQRLAGRRVFYQ